MKLRTLVLTSLLLASSMLTACNNSSSGTSSGSSTSGDIPEGYIRVYFYSDFTQIDTGSCYLYQDVAPNSKITKPADPEVVDPAFPTFLGWSTKELIYTTDDLWNFDSDTIQQNIETQGNKFRIFGIWDI